MSDARGLVVGASDGEIDDTIHYFTRENSQNILESLPTLPWPFSFKSPQFNQPGSSWRQGVKIQNRSPEQENPGRDLRQTDSTEASVLAPRLVC